MEVTTLVSKKSEYQEEQMQIRSILEKKYLSYSDRSGYTYDG